jgi:hypothetical protein
MAQPTTFEVHYKSPEDVHVFRMGALVHRGVFVEDVGDVPLLSGVIILFHLPDLPALQVTGRLVQSSGDGGYVALDLGDDLDALQAAVALVVSLMNPQSLEKMVADAETEFAMAASDSMEVSGESVPEALHDGAEGPLVQPAVVDEASAALLEDVDAMPSMINADPMDEPQSEGSTEESRAGRPEPIRQTVTPVWQLVDTTSDTPIPHQVRALSLKDKLRLARQASRPVRQILIRDVEKNIHVQVVRNPKMSDQEILEFSAMASLSSLALRWIGEQGRHVRNKRVAMNLVTNPSTPPDLAKKLLAGMSVSVLKRVARSTRAREPIRRAAKKKLMDSGEI